MFACRWNQRIGPPGRMFRRSIRTGSPLLLDLQRISLRTCVALPHISLTPVWRQHSMLAQIQREIAQDPYYRNNFDNDGQCLVAWYLRRVLLRDDAQTRDDITDGKDDKEIDAVIVDRSEERRVGK